MPSDAAWLATLTLLTTIGAFFSKVNPSGLLEAVTVRVSPSALKTNSTGTTSASAAPDSGLGGASAFSLASPPEVATGGMTATASALAFESSDSLDVEELDPSFSFFLSMDFERSFFLSLDLERCFLSLDLDRLFLSLDFERPFLCLLELDLPFLSFLRRFDLDRLRSRSFDRPRSFFLLFDRDLLRPRDLDLRSRERDLPRLRAFDLVRVRERFFLPSDVA